MPGRVLCELLAALLAVPATAAAAAPLGSPAKVRAARPADHAGRPGARTEWWRLRGVDTHTGAWLELRLVRDGGLWSEELLVVDPEGEELRGSLDLGLFTSTRRRLAARADGELAIARRRGRVDVVLDDPEATARLRLRHARRGAAAFGWRMKPRPEGGTREERMSWSAIVATSRLSGTLAIRGTPVDVDGWRASYEHGWGSIDLAGVAWVGWDQYVLHGADGAAWILHGLNRRDTVDASGGEKDATWMGVLARVDGRGVRTCRARITRSDWWMTAQLVTWARRVRASCGGMQFSVRDGNGVYDEWTTHDEIRVAARGHGALVGAGLHLTSGGF